YLRNGVAPLGDLRHCIALEIVTKIASPHHGLLASKLGKKASINLGAIQIVSGFSPPHTSFISSRHKRVVAQKTWQSEESLRRLSSTQLDIASGVSRQGRRQSDRISAPQASLTAGEGAADTVC